MIAAGLFTIAGMIAWAAPVPPGREDDGLLLALFAAVCWIVATCCAVGALR